MNRLPSRGRPWGPDDRANASIDRVLAMVRERVPGLVVERDHDNQLFFLGDEFGLDRVQLSGGPPFLVENGGSITTLDENEAAAVIVSWLDEAP